MRPPPPRWPRRSAPGRILRQRVRKDPAELCGRDAVSICSKSPPVSIPSSSAKTENLRAGKECLTPPRSRGGFDRPVLNRVFSKRFSRPAKLSAPTRRSTEGPGEHRQRRRSISRSNIFGGLAEARIPPPRRRRKSRETAEGVSRAAAPPRSPSRAAVSNAPMELAPPSPAARCPLNSARRALAEFDVVVCATSAPGTIVSLAAVEAAMKAPPGPAALLHRSSACRATFEPAVPNWKRLRHISTTSRRSPRRTAGGARRELAKGRAIIGKKADTLWRTSRRKLKRSPPARNTVPLQRTDLPKSWGRAARRVRARRRVHPS